MEVRGYVCQVETLLLLHLSRKFMNSKAFGLVFFFTCPVIISIEFLNFLANPFEMKIISKAVNFETFACPQITNY